MDTKQLLEELDALYIEYENKIKQESYVKVKNFGQSPLFHMSVDVKMIEAERSKSLLIVKTIIDQYKMRCSNKNITITLSDIREKIDRLYKEDLSYLELYLDLNTIISKLIDNDKILWEIIRYDESLPSIYRVNFKKSTPGIEGLFVDYIVEELVQESHNYNPVNKFIFKEIQLELKRLGCNLKEDRRAIYDNYHPGVAYLKFIMNYIADDMTVFKLLGGEVPSNTDWITKPIEFFRDKLRDKYISDNKINLMRLLGQDPGIEETAMICTLARLANNDNLMNRLIGNNKLNKKLIDTTII